PYTGCPHGCGTDKNRRWGQSKGWNQGRYGKKPTGGRGGKPKYYRPEFDDRAVPPSTTPSLGYSDCVYVMDGMVCGDGGNANNEPMSPWEHLLLDVCGMLPVVGEPCDGLNALGYAQEGDELNAGLSLAGTIPFWGWFATAAKWSDNVVDGAKAACSFTGDTEVLMADGSTKPIAEINVGDEVLAADPETGERGPRTVTAVLVHQDTVLDLLTDDGATVTTTEDHPFYNTTDKAWQQAQDLDPGDQLHTTSNHPVRVAGLRPGTQRTATAFNLTVDGIHTYHVRVGSESVLVHNDNGCMTNPFGSGGARPEKAPSYRPTDAGMHPSREAAWEHAVRDRGVYKYAHTRPECSSTACHVHLDIYNNKGQLLETRLYAYPKP
ncbi:MAG: polymorphic toxin-type HINT domain-containing protein, partial [Gammaproteobacteria bacterium]